MSHYAKVVDGYVTDVAVVDDDQFEAFAAAMGGQWIKTSYNTRDGVHYGQDGKPDGGEALRMNYAQVGYVYDEVADAFYPENKTAALSDAFYFDAQTKKYKMALPNKAVARRKDTSVGERKIYVTNMGAQALSAVVMDNLEASLNVLFVHDPAQAEIALPMNDSETRHFALRPEFRDIRPLSARALWNLTDRALQHKLNVPTLPCYALTSAEDFLAKAPAGEAVFIKRQRTPTKDTGPLAYTRWDNPQAFVDHVSANHPNFWVQQAQDNEMYGQYIAQPYIQAPFKDLDVRLAVNAMSEVYVFSVMQMEHQEDTKLGSWKPYNLGLPAELEQAIREDVKAQQLKPGIHFLQFAPYKGAWALLDWNPRLTGCHQQLFPSVYPVLDNAFLFMLGLPIREDLPMLHMEQRSYREHGLGREVAPLIGECGLFPRWEGDTLGRVAGIGSGSREVDDRYALLDHKLSLLSK